MLKYMLEQELSHNSVTHFISSTNHFNGNKVDGSVLFLGTAKLNAFAN